MFCERATAPFRGHPPRGACQVTALATPSAALSAAMNKVGINNSQLARTLGVSETIVRGLRNGSRPLRDDRISLFGPRLRAAFDEALRGPVQLTLF